MAQTPTVHVLGTAQDGGYPHIGCTCPHCRAARQEPERARLVASIGLVGETGRCLLVDATPDLPAQIDALGHAAGRRGPSVDAIVLTHAHVGHYLGLALLGREALSAARMPVHGTKRMAAFLEGNRPWAHLVSRGEIELHRLEPGRPLAFDGVEVHAFLAPHRAEDTDTLGLELVGPNRRLVYMPDTDHLEDAQVVRIRDADVALIDGTFFSRDELRHRDMLAVRHPCVVESVERLGACRGDVRFIHLNHTNALLHPTAPASLPEGFGVATEGDRFEL